MTTHVLGVRHHGPGSARAVRAALDRLKPDCVLVEGPPDADAQIPVLAEAGLVPPIALLVYPPDEPGRVAIYPFAAWSPELLALKWALAHGAAVAFMDLPVSRRVPVDRASDAEPSGDGDAPGGDELVGEAEALAGEVDAPLDEPDDPDASDEPFGLHTLAEVAGYSDHDAFWEELVELRANPEGVFEAIEEAVAALRPDLPPTEVPTEATALRAARREAWMRKVIRDAEKQYDTVAVICGAWHAPALVNRPTASHDQQLLRGLSRTKVDCTWVPWTHGRLTFASGYGAGVWAPGWYQHVWESDGGDLASGWVSRAARALRDAGHDVSSAHVIEAVRLANGLAALRDRSQPGLTELRDAMMSVMAGGEQGALAVVRGVLEIGEALGEVPDSVPTVPLLADVEAKQRSLRLKPSTEARRIKLDLREERNRDKSHLLHQLALIGVPWGEPEHSSGDGTFWEAWVLEWDPGFSVRLVMGNLWGPTTESAATAFTLDKAAKTEALPELVQLGEGALLAGLPEALDGILARLRDVAAVDTDVLHLMQAIGPLARTLRYGDVRGTPVSALEPVLQGLFDRVIIGVPLAVRGLSAEAAAELLGGVQAVADAVALLARPEWESDWDGLLARIADDELAHPMLRGRAVRFLLERGHIDDDALATHASRALSVANEPVDAAAWLEGVLRGSGLLLLHQDGLWRALDGWLVALDPELFDELLPSVRRAFSEFEPAERRKMGARVRDLDKATAVARPVEAPDRDEARAARVVPILRLLVGVSDG